jgi:hypothetical protein
LPSGKGNRAFWSDHGKALGRGEKKSKVAKLLRSQKRRVLKVFTACEWSSYDRIWFPGTYKEEM